MLRSILLKTLILSFCCALTFTAVYGMEEEKGKGLPRSMKASASQQCIAPELPPEMWKLILGQVPFSDLAGRVPLVSHTFKILSEAKLKESATSTQLEKAKDASGNVSINSLKKIIRDFINLPYFTIINKSDNEINLKIKYEYISSADGLENLKVKKKSSLESTLPSNGQILLRKMDFPTEHTREEEGIIRIKALYTAEKIEKINQGIAPSCLLHGTMIIAPMPVEHSWLGVSYYYTVENPNEPQINL
jgi:hypothetical protein